MNRVDDFHSVHRTAKIEFPVRARMGVVILFAALITYVQRINMSMALISMVWNPKAENVSCEEPGQKFHWSSVQEGCLISAYFIGYFVAALPAWMLAEKVNVKWLIGFSMMIITILTGLIPLTASVGYVALIIVRAVTGVVSSVILPGFYHLLENWAPVEETGKFVSIMFVGGMLGLIGTFQISGFIQSMGGWEWCFYCYVIITIIVTIAWVVVVTDTPIENKWIRRSELQYIMASIDAGKFTNLRNAPVRKIVTSGPFWALLFLHFSYMWGFLLYLTTAPKFLREVLVYTAPSCGFFSSIPLMIGLASALILRQVGDYLIEIKKIPAIQLRKYFCVLSHIVPGISYILVGVFGGNLISFMILLTLAFFCSGAIKVTSLQHPEDIAPNFSTTLFVLINFITIIPGIVIPILVGYATRNHSTLREWSYMYVSAGVMSLVSAFCFVTFGSGEVQDWNEI